MNITVWTSINYLSRGLSAFPLQPRGKRPTGSWSVYQERRASFAEASAWSAGNLGIVTGAISGVVVVDCESIEDANWFLSHRACGLRPGVATTPRGVHLYFQHPGERVPNATHVCDHKGVSRYDVRGDGGYVVAPPSVVVANGDDITVSGRYQWIREFTFPTELPLFRLAWRPETKPAAEPVRKNGAAANSGSPRIRDGARYIQHIHAVSGSGGHNDTFRAVCRLRDSGLDELEAYAVLCEWNETNANPRWSQRELLHKVKSVFSKG